MTLELTTARPVNKEHSTPDYLTEAKQEFIRISSPFIESACMAVGTYPSEVNNAAIINSESTLKAVFLDTNTFYRFNILTIGGNRSPDIMTWANDAFCDVIISPIEPFKVVYVGEHQLSLLLGDEGKIVLHRVLDVIKNYASNAKWPLGQIIVKRMQDYEIEDWQYVVITLCFNSSFEDADAYLHMLYPQLDAMAAKLNASKERLFTHLFFFDIEVADSNVQQS